MIAKQLPRYDVPYSFGSRYIRYFLVKNFINSCGQNIKIQAGVSLSPLIDIGNNCNINVNVKIRANVKIGNDVLIGPNVNIISVNHEFKERNIPMRLQGNRLGKVSIEDNVWIGTNAIILPNIKIETGAIVGAGSVVTKDIKAYSIVAGNPAKFIKLRA
jgi:maltose O-acetyltransferase